MKRRAWFVTGTDTNVGKTWVSVALVHALRAQGLRVLAMKPVASGCARTEQGLRNEDALMLQGAASLEIAYEQVNPYAFEEALSPHLAAERASVVIDVERIAREVQVLAAASDGLVVEGVGGWRTPLGANKTVGDMAARLNLPVILVVGMRLGCVNHALLTAESIERAGLPLAGWVANMVDTTMEAVTENVRDLDLRLNAPLLGVLPHMRGHNPRQAAGALNVQPLLSS